MCAHPRVSVVMPVLNREKYLPVAVDSILAQSYNDWELIISDGGSRDATRDILDRYAKLDKRISWSSNSEPTVAMVRNAILSTVKGELIAVLDSDDVALPERLAIQTAFLDRHPELAGAGSNIRFIDAKGNLQDVDKFKMRLSDPEELRQRELAGWGCFVHSSMMVRRAAMEAVKGYRNIFRYAEDDDLYLRLLERYDLTNLPDCLVHYRWHGENTCTPTLMTQLYRAVAVASAHQRINRLPDMVAGRDTAFDYAFLSTMMDQLGNASLPVRLFWIGMLQHYGVGERGMLQEAWRYVLEQPYAPTLEPEVRRHWGNYRNSFAVDMEATRDFLTTHRTAWSASLEYHG